MGTLSCNSTIDKANASGIETFSVDYPIDQNYKAGEAIKFVPNPSWAVTVDEISGETQRTIWYNTAGQNYSDDLGLNYDVCAYVISGLPKNTIELGQNDPGDCSSMLSAACREDILTRLSESAYKWTSYYSPGPYSNLSADAVSSLCGGYILPDLGEDGKPYPRSCRKEFGLVYDTNDPGYNTNPTAESMALTGYNSSILDDGNCRLDGAGKTFWLADGPWHSRAADSYDAYTRDVFPALTVFFPVANYERTSMPDYAVSRMQCLRIKNFSEGSRVSPKLPEGTPYSYGSSLGGGAIAGITVGLVAFVLVAAGLAYWFWRRRRRQQIHKTATVDDGRYNAKELDSEELYELKSQDRKQEMDSSPIHELGADAMGAEMPDKATSSELGT
jgi:hypothetical protein